MRWSNKFGNIVQDGHTSLERWQAKIRRLRQYLRGMCQNCGWGVYKEKKSLLDKLDEFEKNQK